jgi:hypothetical protein
MHRLHHQVSAVLGLERLKLKAINGSSLRGIYGMFYTMHRLHHQVPAVLGLERFKLNVIN